MKIEIVIFVFLHFDRVLLMLQKQTPLHVPLDNSVARPYVNTRFRP